MAKTRSQTENIAIKKEEQEDCKPTLLLNRVSNVTKNKITKRKPSSNRPLPAQQVKVEEDSDTKALLKSSSQYPKVVKTQRITQEKINQLVDYIVNDNMSVTAASHKLNISSNTASYYYKLYKNDPEKRIPVPRYDISKIFKQEQIGNLIRYIDTDKMTVKDAAAKANLAYKSGKYYYNKYLKDPNHMIPIAHSYQTYTQDQKSEFIGYVINDKMNILAASKRAEMNPVAGYRHYHKYFEQQNPDIATPSHITTNRTYTQKQIKEVISYIVHDKMSIVAASRKTNFCPWSAGKYYRQYLIDNSMDIPVIKNKRYTQDEINKFIGYIVDDKMSVIAASKKANMSAPTGIKYYRQYLKDRHVDYSIRKFITQGQINELIGYIVHDKMSIHAASKKANMPYESGYKYYRQYQNDQKRNAPT
jgi:transposase